MWCHANQIDGLTLFLALGFGVARAQEVKLGYVDVRRALYETEDGVKAVPR